MSSETLEADVAQIIWDTIEQGGLCAPVRSQIGVDDLERAYRVQQLNTERRIDRGEHIVGVKVGLTSEAVQQQLGVDQPDFGVLTDAMQVNESTAIPWSELFQPKAEAEIAFELGEDLPARRITIEELKKAIASVAPSIEVVGSRIEGWDIRITDTIADNASASHFVLGSARHQLEDVDLVNCNMQLERNGTVVSKGQGSACLGNPLHAALWLVNKWADIGMPLKKGYWILAGALGPMVPAEPGDVFQAHIEGLGAVQARFASKED